MDTVTLMRGDFVRIVRYKNSLHNYYIGYNAEVKEYRHKQRHALVFLEATAEPRTLYLPIESLVKIRARGANTECADNDDEDAFK